MKINAQNVQKKNNFTYFVKGGGEFFFIIFYTAGYMSQREEKEFFPRGLFVTCVFSMSYENTLWFASIFQGGFAPMGKKSVIGGNPENTNPNRVPVTL
ncbi:MAG: hypothetical protein Q4D62_15425 [Planctomycetia bacterium]|nr:hypothetical protein [Planctomycetia bacterium]